MKDYTASEIADYFLARTNADVGDLISNLKLQKLCYYAQGVAVAARGRPLFPEKLEAWLHGPVVPDLYRRFKSYEHNAIPPIEGLDLDRYDPADRVILDDVFDEYGQYSAWRLREMTHDDTPWLNAYRDGANNEITVGALAEFFATQINDDYRRKHAELRQR